MPTTIEYALLAGASYYDNRAAINRFPLPKDWGVFSRVPQDETTGFEASAFTNGTDLVISYAGTDFSQLASDFLFGNIPLAAGRVSDQLKQAAEYYLQIKAQAHTNTTITLTGHSLGGGIAALIGVFFGETAKTFDQAPFYLTARLGASILKDYLVTKRDADGNRFYSDDELTGLTGFIQQQQANGGVPNNGLVTNINVQGEIVSLGSFIRIGNDSSIEKGASESSFNPIFATNLHSQALLTAFLQSQKTAATGQALNEVTKKLTDLLGMIFDSKLYAFPQDRINTDNVNFLERLVQHEAGVRNPATGATTLDSDAMVTRFTADLWKLAKDNGLTMNDGNSGFFTSATNNVSKALIAFAMQKYYEETKNSPGYNKELFTQVTGGIQFDMADVADKFAKAFKDNQKLTLDDAKGYKEYFSQYLGTSATLGSSPFTPEERSLIASILPYQRDWYVQAGASGLTVADDKNRNAFMLGGSGADQMTGGTAADLLVGNAGADTLTGGKDADRLEGGLGNDTYGADVIRDADGQGSIKWTGADGVERTVSGGHKIAPTVWQSEDEQFDYWFQDRPDGSKNLLISNGADRLIVEQWQDGALGIALKNAPTTPDNRALIRGDQYNATFPIITVPYKADLATRRWALPSSIQAERYWSELDSLGGGELVGAANDDNYHLARRAA